MRLNEPPGVKSIAERECSSSGRCWACVNQPLCHRLDPEIESFQCSRTEQGEVTRFSEHDIVGRAFAGDVNEGWTGPPFQDGPVGLAEVPLGVALDAERFENLCGHP